MQNLDMRVHQTGFSSTSSITLHSHAGTDLHEFHYFLEGDGQFWNGGREHQVGPGSLFLSGPEDFHQAKAARADRRFRMYWLLFAAEDDTEGLLPEVKSRFETGAPLTIGRGQTSAFEDIRRRWASPDPYARRSADFRLSALLCDLAATNQHDTPGAARYINEALGLMQASIHEPLDLTALSGKLGIDKSYFVRLFRRHVGQPPMRYFLGLRLDSAKHRLLGGDESLRTIALDLGFHDEFHFSHQFKAHVGQSPQVFKGHS
jgi:AraC-like DNA-binding protein/quercetin dioxygenase-like cupin family protein